MSPADALLRLALVPGLGPITAARLVAAVDEPSRLFSWTMARLQEIDGVGPERARRIVDPRGDELVVAERATALSLGVRILTQADEAYPADLRRLVDPPLAIWLRGELQPRDRLAVAVVGPRRPSAYGHRQARRLAGGLARLGCCIVSGLARGIDTVAHEAAVDTPAGRTIAVLGSGFARLYPEENTALAARIAEGRGAVVSEFPCQQPPSPGTFPRRNRIVASLSLATLVVEAGERSGALITARHAGELGREVLVLPGPVDRPEFVGCHRLIRDGATLVTSVEDIVAEVGPLATLAAGNGPAPAESPAEMRAASLSGRERDLYRLLDDAPRTVDDIVALTQLPASVVQAVLITLEIRRLARRQPGGFVRAH